MAYPAGPVDFGEIRGIARRRVADPQRWEDVAQTACLYALTHRPANSFQHVIDAIRHELGDRRTMTEGGWSIRHPLGYEIDRLASLYPTESELLERWHAEESEDQADEWRGMAAAERDARISESRRALGSSP